ncbi:low-specificity L-threonine aldolase [Chloroflexota bacterium]
MKIIDLRSDTVTLPTQEMREAMMNASVGDDVYGEDPTINELQEISAGIVGKEAGLFVSSGTMGNLIAMLVHCQRGDEVILGDKAHTFLYEAGGISALGGVHSFQLANQPDGSIKVEDILASIRGDDPHEPVTKLIALENTHNRCGGSYQNLGYINEVCSIARENKLSVHMDGARIFNAAAASKVHVKKMVENVDSITFCLSKGLCAPVGSVLCGTDEFISKAHRIRKQLGGGMRQAGIIAAAGIVALQKMTNRLEEDHLHARILAEGLGKIPGIIIENGLPITNMVFINITENIPMSTEEIKDHLEKLGIRVGIVGDRRYRMVTHYWISGEDITHTIDGFRSLLNE